MDETEQYILKELAYSAERSTWFELNGQYAITLQNILTRKDAEIERLREGLFTILCNTDPHAIRHRDYDHLAKNIFDCASAALKEKE